MLMIREGLGEPRAAQKMTLTSTDMHMKVTWYQINPNYDHNLTTLNHFPQLPALFVGFMMVHDGSCMFMFPEHTSNIMKAQLLPCYGLKPAA